MNSPSEAAYSEKSAAYFDSDRRDAISLINPGGLRVLDVGCGSGVVGSQLKAGGAKVVVGIEIETEAARRAAMVIDRVLVGDVSTIELDFEPASFDLLLCLDVLEHLTYPTDALKRLIPLLTNDATVIVSLPNIRYAGTLKKLIFEADWPRLPSGIFDATHLRWFTDKVARRMFAESGLTVVSRRRNPVPVLARLAKKVPIINVFLSDWLTTQFIYKLKISQQ